MASEAIATKELMAFTRIATDEVNTRGTWPPAERIGSDTPRMRPVALISLLEAFIDIRAVVATAGVAAGGAVPAGVFAGVGHRAKAILAAAVITPLRIDTVSVLVAVRRQRRWQSRRSQRALIYVRAVDAITPIPWLHAGAVVRPSADNVVFAKRVGTIRKRVTDVRAIGALVHVSADDPIARVPRGAGAAEGPGKIRAIGLATKAVVIAGRALIDLHAGVARGRISTLARARTPDEMRKRGGTACAATRPGIEALLARGITAAARRATRR